MMYENRGKICSFWGEESSGWSHLVGVSLDIVEMLYIP